MGRLDRAKRGDKYLLICLLASFVTGVLSFIYFVWQDGGFFTVLDDFNTQQLTFSAAVQTTLKEQGGGQWCWNLDLGSSLITGFSFYNLGSIFYWISFLFPKTWFPYLVAWLYVLKYTAAGAFAYLYLKRFVKNPNYAVIGGVLYAFSGYQTTNLEFFHFHEVVAFFPLLLLGLEQLAGEKREKRLFIFAVFINCITSYFFFVQEVIFLVIYFVFRFWGKPWKQLFRDCLTSLLCGILGVGMASILFLPSVMFITGSTRVDNELLLSRFVYEPRKVLFALKGFLFPGEAMKSHSALIEMRWMSTGSYLPFVGLSGVFAYLMRPKKDWLNRLLLLLVVISFSPMLCSLFLGFTEATQRWWFMMTLMMALATVIVLDQKQEHKLNASIAINVGVTVLFYLMLRYLPWDAEGESVVLNQQRLDLWLAISVIGPVLLGVILNWKWLAKRPHCILAGVMAFCTLTTSLTLHFYRLDCDREFAVNQYSVGTKLKVHDEQYRYNTTENFLTLTGEAGGIGCFSSTIENSSRNFNMLLGFQEENSTQDRNLRGLPELLGGKYIVTTDSWRRNIVDEVVSNGITYYIVTQPACPIGFAVNHYITESQLLKLERQKPPIALMNAVVVRDEDVSLVSEIATNLDLKTVNFSNLSTYVNRSIKYRVEDFDRSSTGFTCTTAYDKQSLVFFSVPYDTGWRATIDGEEATIVDTCGMMAICVPEGEHALVFTYRTPGFGAGVAITAVCWGVFVLYCVLLYRKNRKKGQE